MRMNRMLLPAILVLNERYLSSSPAAAARVGAASFALDVIEGLRSANIPVTMVLYRRKAGLRTPRMEPIVRNNIRCVEIWFDFDMDDSQVQSIIASAAMHLVPIDRDSRPPILYYQTDTLLRFHPPYLPACVTHHAPFFEDFTNHFSESAACTAFGSAEKAWHLMDQQELGMQVLLKREDIFVIQHSQLQRCHLLKRGISERRIFAVTPPVNPLTSSTTELDPAIIKFIQDANILLYTAVARLDYFKRVDLLVDAGVRLMERGLRANVLIIGGDGNDDHLRKALIQNVPRVYLNRFLVTQRLERDQLHLLFRLARSRSIFVCPSRYETLGITPLEAALSGVCTVISDSTLVEASRFFPPYLKFDPTVDGLVRLIEGLGLDALDRDGEHLRWVRERRVSKTGFERDLILAWRVFSSLALETRHELLFGVMVRALPQSKPHTRSGRRVMCSA
jgi:glycosyltransferase involved in cell wall biosynthesis